MFVFTAICSFFIAGSYAFPSRIVNGTDAHLGEIPYIVSIQLDGSHNCGGSILDATHILTAAHCVQGFENRHWEIQYGIIDIGTKENRIPVTRKVYHEDYNPYNNYANDIAVLTLAEPIQFSQYAQPAVLPEMGEDISENSPSVLAGWGYPYSGGGVMKILQVVDLLLYSDADCKRAHGSSVDPAYHVCSGIPEGGKGQCSGDSGGPLYSEGKQVGVVSWSVKPCARPGYPGVFARVSSYINWIYNQMDQ